jgi:hypothetical protein
MRVVARREGDDTLFGKELLGLTAGFGTWRRVEKMEHPCES